MKQRRIDRLHGRIMSVETKVRGDALAEDAAAGATTLVVGDAADFDEDGGWLVVNDQVVEYTEVDDDEGTITLVDGLTAAADEGDAVHVWSTLYDEVVDYQEALVELDGEYDNPEPVVAEVAEGVGDLPEGDRGVDGESCSLLRVSDDEWEVVGVGGRARKSKGIRFEADDVYVLTAADVTAGTATVSLSKRPIDESVKLWWRTVAQEPTEYTVNYDQRTITYPLDGFEAAGDRIWVHYAYRKGLTRPGGLDIPIGHTWKYANGLVGVGNDNVTEALGAATYAAPGFDDSAWASGPSGFGYGGSPAWNTSVGPQLTVWTRTTGTTSGGPLRLTVYNDWRCWLYIDGELAWSSTTGNDGSGHEIACPAGDHVFAAYGWDEPTSPDAVLGIAIKEIL